MRFVLLSLLLLIQTQLLAQQPQVTITITGPTGSPVENVTAELLRTSDSTLARTALTNSSGLAEFTNLKTGTYFIRATAVGMQPAFSSPFTLGAEPISLPALQLQAKAASQMNNVTVTARKPFIQKLTDRIVVNVESSPLNAGSTALEILERSPGVAIDQNDLISLRGRAGVIIMIDGKLSPMSGQDLANYLRGLPSNAIERIDIITNPSAKYDAAGNSGIIDIRMKKDQRFGANGTLTAGLGQGVYPKANAGSTLNYRNKKFNLFGNYNYAYRENLNHLIINRNFYNNGTFIGSDDKDNYAHIPFSSHTIRAGADFFPSKKTVWGFVVNSNFSAFDRRADITTIVNNAQNVPDFRFYSLGTNDDNNRNAVANLNFKHSFDSTGRELTADVDYGLFRSQSLTRTASSFYELDGSPKTEDDILDGNQLGRLRLATAKMDYVHPMKKGFRFEAGFKTSYVYSDNNARFFNVFPTFTQVDSGKTNRFFYTEYNNAAYANFSGNAKKFNYQLGMRTEQTRVRTRQQQGDKRNGQDYIRFFPSAFLNYKIAEEKTIGLSLSRRIDRPGYSQLNPFLFQIDPTIYGTGNPALLAQMTWSYELSYTVKSMNFTLGYSRTVDPHNVVLSRIQDVIPDFVIKPGQSPNITVQIPVNLISSDYFGLSGTVPVRVAKWWNQINTFNAYYNRFNGNLGGVELNDGAPAGDIRTNNNFTFKKGWAAELNANLNTGGRYGYMVSRYQWGLAVGGQKTIMKGKGTLRLNFTDIFWTNRPRAVVTYEGRYVENWQAYRETRVANLVFSYRFGNNKVQAARRRTTASEEERRRAGSN